MAVGDLTVMRNIRTGYHNNERSCRRDEKVTRNNDKKLRLCLKVTVENFDRDNVQLLQFLHLLQSVTKTLHNIITLFPITV